MDELGIQSLDFSLSFYWRVCYSLQHQRFVLETKEREPEILFVGDSLISHLIYTDMWETMFAPLHPVRLSLLLAINHRPTLITLSCLFQLNFGIGGDQTQHVLWRLANGELDNIKPKVKSLCFLAFCLFPPCLNKVCWLRSKEVDAERFASHVGAQDDCVWCLTIQHTAGKANQIRPFFLFSRTSYGHFPPPSYRWTPRRAKGSNEIISWIMQQLCNKLSDHTFKIEKGKHKQQQKRSEKTRDFYFFPLS